MDRVRRSMNVEKERVHLLIMVGRSVVAARMHNFSKKKNS